MKNNTVALYHNYFALCIMTLRVKISLDLLDNTRTNLTLNGRNLKFLLYLFTIRKL